MSIVTLSDRFDRAVLVYATHIHAGQVRKGTPIPYVAHLLAVAALILEHGATKNKLLPLSFAMRRRTTAVWNVWRISVRFGEGVEAIVRECSDALPGPGEPKGEWKGRKQAYLDHLAEAEKSVLLVVAADKLHNARAIVLDHRDVGEQVWGRFKGSPEDTLRSYRTIVETLGQRLPGSLTAELARTVAQLEMIVTGAGSDSTSAEAVRVVPSEMGR